MFYFFKRFGFWQMPSIFNFDILLHFKNQKHQPVSKLYNWQDLISLLTIGVSMFSDLPSTKHYIKVFSQMSFKKFRKYWFFIPELNVQGFRTGDEDND